MDDLRLTTLPSVVLEYTEAHGYVFDRRDRDTDEQDAKVSGTRSSDIVSTVALDHEGGRARLARLCRRLQHISRDATAVLNDLSAFFQPPDDDLQPLAHYREPSAAERMAQREAHDAREERRLRDELARLHDRERRIMARLAVLTR